MTPEDPNKRARPRRPGRPQSARIRQAILDSTLQLLIEQGYERMSIEAVASHAGVGKATIYRRWATKEEMVSEALSTIIVQVPIPDSGNTQQDLKSLLRQFATAANRPQFGPAVRRAIGTATSNPQFLEIIWNNHASPRRQAIQQVLDRAYRRGELRLDVDLEMAVDMLAGAIVFRLLFDRLDSTSLLQYPDQVVSTLWNGIRAEMPQSGRSAPTHNARFDESEAKGEP